MKCLTEGQTVKVKVLDANEKDQRISLSMKEFEEQADGNYGDYELPEESKGFQLGDMIGDQLKKFK